MNTNVQDNNTRIFNIAWSFVSKIRYCIIAQSVEDETCKECWWQLWRITNTTSNLFKCLATSTCAQKYFPAQLWQEWQSSPLERLHHSITHHQSTIYVPMCSIDWFLWSILVILLVFLLFYKIFLVKRETYGIILGGWEQFQHSQSVSLLVCPFAVWEDGRSV